MEKKIKKGDKVVVGIINRHGNSASKYIDMSIDNINNWTYDAEVVVAGRKYITVKILENDRKMQFSIEDDYNERTEYSPEYRLYLSKEEIINEREHEEIYNYIHFEFDYPYVKNKFTLDQLKRIKEIMNEE